MAEQGCEKHGHINCTACADEATIASLYAELATYKAQTLAALQWAGEFQDGAFVGVLELGDSAIVKGGEWLVAEVKRLRAEVARLTQERDAALRPCHYGHRLFVNEGVPPYDEVCAVCHAQHRSHQAEAERDALRARVWMVESALTSAVAILDGEMGNWREHFHADACVIDAALAPEQEKEGAP